VIPTYQRCASVRRLLESLSLQRLPCDRFEVVVAIDGSTDGTQEMVCSLETPYSLRAVWQPNGGRAAACNAGVRESRGEVVVVLDDDMEPHPTFLDAHARAHEAHARRGVVGAVPIQVDASSPPVVQFVGEKFNRHLASLAEPGRRIDIRDFYSGNFSIRCELLLEVGSFDESFRIYGNEDVELATRLLAAGVELVYSPEAAAAQHYEKDFAALARDNLAKGRTAVLCARKHPDAVARLRLGTLHQGSRKWRLLRSSLLAASGSSERIPELLIRFVTWTEQRQPAAVYRLYAPVLDFCFWFGVRAALGDQGADNAEELVGGTTSLGAVA
jgi:GT2 family glycosyltransferase